MSASRPWFAGGWFLLVAACAVVPKPTLHIRSEADTRSYIGPTVAIDALPYRGHRSNETFGVNLPDYGIFVVELRIQAANGVSVSVSREDVTLVLSDGRRVPAMDPLKLKEELNVEGSSGATIGPAFAQPQVTNTDFQTLALEEEHLDQGRPTFSGFTFFRLYAGQAQPTAVEVEFQSSKDGIAKALIYLGSREARPAPTTRPSSSSSSPSATPN